MILEKKLNSKKYIVMCEIIITIVFICQKLGSVRPVELSCLRPNDVFERT